MSLFGKISQFTKHILLNYQKDIKDKNYFNYNASINMPQSISFFTAYVIPVPILGSTRRITVFEKSPHANQLQLDV